jgi:hypothetical protein
MAAEIDDWHLQAWLQHFGKIQSSLVNELGWDKSKANFVYHGKQQYKREIVNAVADWLGIKPYELLMPPEQALAIRRLRQSAEEILSTSDRFLPPEGQVPARRKTGTR